MKNTNATVEVVQMTPAMAKEILKINTANRAMTAQRAYWVRNLMERGEFVVNGDTVKISWDNTLLDGQHRLWGISKMPDGFVQTVIVVRGLDPETFSTLDSGKARTTKDILEIAGHKEYASHVGVIIKAYHIHITKKIILKAVNGINKHLTLSNSAILNIVNKDPHLYKEIARVAYHRDVKKIASLSLTGTAMLKLIRDDGHDMETVFQLCYMLANPSEYTSPNKEIVKVHNWLVSQRELGIKPPPTETVKMIISAFESALNKINNY